MSLITIFNGRKRGLGEWTGESCYVQVDVSLRNHLAKFQGPQLAIFLSIALHSDKDGWSGPSITKIHRETGYNRQTVSAAIRELNKLEIEGNRVMLNYQSTGVKGRFNQNKYLIFPTEEDVRRFAKPSILHDSPYTGFPHTVGPYAVRPSTDNSTPIEEVEPLFKEIQYKEESGEEETGGSPSPRQSDEEYLAELQANPGYCDLNVAMIYGKMVDWCREKGKQPTRSRLVKWLNTEERSMTALPKTGDVQNVQHRETTNLRRLRESQELLGITSDSSGADHSEGPTRLLVDGT
jgi:hypothetical protein